MVCIRRILQLGAAHVNYSKSMPLSNNLAIFIQVVKHWFRNTLFKERQRNKDSPYNFNNPPSTTLNLEEYERTGQAKVTAVSQDANDPQQNAQMQQSIGHGQQSGSGGSQHDSRPHSQPSSIASMDRADLQQMIKSEPSDDLNNSLLMDESPFHQHSHSLALAAAAAAAAQQHHLQQQQQAQQKNSIDHHHHQSMLMDNDGNSMHHQNMYYNNFETKSESGSSEILSRPPTPNSSSYSNINDIINQQIESIPINNIANMGGGGSISDSAGGSSMGPPKKFQLNKIFDKSFDANSNSSNSSTSSGKRANRTRFTDYQIKVLQEFFENNSYPKDSDLEYLSNLLHLSPRVIVVWFQVGYFIQFFLAYFQSTFFSCIVCKIKLRRWN